MPALLLLGAAAVLLLVSRPGVLALLELPRLDFVLLEDLALVLLRLVDAALGAQLERQRLRPAEQQRSSSSIMRASWRCSSSLQQAPHANAAAGKVPPAASTRLQLALRAAALGLLRRELRVRLSPLRHLCCSALAARASPQVLLPARVLRVRKSHARTTACTSRRSRKCQHVTQALPLSIISSTGHFFATTASITRWRPRAGRLPHRRLLLLLLLLP